MSVAGGLGGRSPGPRLGGASAGLPRPLLLVGLLPGPLCPHTAQAGSVCCAGSSEEHPRPRAQRLVLRWDSSRPGGMERQDQAL